MFNKYYFMPGDRVKHVGRSQLLNKVGEIISRVQNADAFVVEFGDDSYVVYGDDLERHNFVSGVELPSKRRRRDEEDD
jgi:hypothetical protein